MSKNKSPLLDLPVTTPNFSYADWSTSNTLTMNFGELVPTKICEILPGTEVDWSASRWGRTTPLLSPVFGKVNMFSYRFRVRHRDIATYFDSLITNGDQRLTWQQNNSQFVPPVLSKFDPFFLLASYKFNDYPYAFPSNFETLTPEIIQNGTGQKATVLQILELDSDDEEYAGMTELSSAHKYLTGFEHEINCAVLCVEMNFGGDPNAVNVRLVHPVDNNGCVPIESNALYFVHRPNRNERSSHSEGQKWFNQTYNPFSSGTLLDYLGIDMKGAYIKQYPFYKDMIQDCLSKCWSGSVTIASNIWQYMETHFDIKEWLNNHWCSYVVMFGNGIDDQYLQFVTNGGFVDQVMTLPTNYTPEKLTRWQNAVNPYYGADNYEGEVLPPKEKHLLLSMLPIHAYNFVYNEWFRDQNFVPINPLCAFDRQGEFTLDHDLDMDDYVDYFCLKTKAWEKDTFTTALPQAQRGQPVRYLQNASLIAVDLPADTHYAQPGWKYMYSALGNNALLNPHFTNDGVWSTNHLSTSGDPNPTQKLSELTVNLESATIENLRWANKMQQFLEIKARTGNRYFEMMQGLWGVSIDDAKINRPIFMDGTKTPIQISEVLQTSETSETSALGDMAGRGVASSASKHLHWKQDDYCFIIEISAVVPRLSYMRGLDKMWTRSQYLDWPWFKFAQLGEETVDKREILFNGDNEERPFGFQSRYYDWKLKLDECHGDFKDTLKYWTFARDFDSVPFLNKQFLEVKPDYRQFAVQSSAAHHVLVNVEHDIEVKQPLPHLPVPAL